jgi:hypothetical protein
MPTATYIALANTTLSSTATSITFSSIPANYQDLIVIMSIKLTAGAETKVQFNSSTANYSMAQAAFTGSSNFSNGGVGNSWAWITPNSFTSTGEFDNCIMHIMDYSTTNKHKGYVSRYNSLSTNNYSNMIAGRWSETQAISSLTIYVSSNSFTSGSTFAIYGVAA